MVATVETISEPELHSKRRSTSVSSAPSVVKKSGSMNSEPGIWNTLIHREVAEVNGGPTIITDQRFGNSEDLFLDHYSLTIERSADSSGNALGFAADSVITEYLYNQQYYDVISGQYYMRARNYDPATGTFTQQDTISIAPGDTANANLFLFAGADPVNMSDPSGHDLMETLGSIAIQSMLGSIISPVVAPFASDAAALLIPPALMMALEAAGSPDAVELGVDGSVGGQFEGVGGFIAGGLSLLASTHTGNAALYASGGGGFSLFGGGNGLSGGIGASVGLVWNTPRSGDFVTNKLEVSVPFGVLPASFRAKVERDLAESAASSSFLTDMEANRLVGAGWTSTKVDSYQWQVMKDAFARISWLTSRLDSMNVSLFGSVGNPGGDIGVSFGVDLLGAETEGTTGGVSLGYMWGHQIAPQQSVYLG